MSSYNLELLSLKRELPIIKIREDLTTASFVILGDAELVQTVAPAIAEKSKGIDVIATAEAKGIPLAYEVSKILGMKEFIMARKGIKSYMDSPITEEVNSIATKKQQFLCLDKVDSEKINGKKVAIIDDVISIGESLRSVEDLVEKIGGIVKAKAAISAEGGASNRDDIIFLKRLPLFRVDENESFIEV